MLKPRSAAEDPFESQKGASSPPKPNAAVSMLPFYTGLAPSPTDGRSAFGVIRCVPDGVEPGVSVVLEDEVLCQEIFRFDHLAPLRLAWNPSGDHLAFAQGTVMIVRDVEGNLHLETLPGNARWIGYDRDDRLWCLSEKTLIAWCGGRLELTIDDVEIASANRGACYVIRQSDGLRVYLHDGHRGRSLPWCPDVDEAPTVRFSADGRYLLVAARAGCERDRARAQIALFDLTSEEMHLLFDGVIAVGLSGGPDVDAVPLPNGTALACYETGAFARLWALAPDAEPLPISPDGCEVFDFATDPTGTQVAIIASNGEDDSGAFERQLLFGKRVRDAWQMSQPIRGVFDSPCWRGDGRVEVLCGERGRWARRIHGRHDTTEAATPTSCQVASASDGATSWDILRLKGTMPGCRKAGIIFMSRLHQQFTLGVQSFFFHHALIAIAANLANDGYSVVAVNGPGAIGRGRGRREPDQATGSYFAQMKRAIDGVQYQLREEGCLSIGVVAGSLAAVLALRMIGVDTKIAACACVAPLFEASIPPVTPWWPQLFDDPLIHRLEQAAQEVRTPLLVVHGARDESAPIEQVTRVRAGIGNRTPFDLLLLEDEGHIFKRIESWRRTELAITNFFSTHLPTGASDHSTSSRTA